MIYLAQRLDTGEVVEFEDDPNYVVGQGEPLVLPLGGERVQCVRIFSIPQVVATDRRKRYDENYMQVRSDGRFSTFQLPSREQCLKSGLPLAPYYDSNDDASFMNRHEASEYSKKLSENDPHGGYSFDA